MESNLVLITKTELQSMLNDAVKSTEKVPVVTQPQATHPPKFLTILDMCEMFGVSRTTISSWMKSGKLPFKRISRRVFFLLSEVLDSIPSFDLKSVATFQKSIQKGG